MGLEQAPRELLWAVSLAFGAEAIQFLHVMPFFSASLFLLHCLFLRAARQRCRSGSVVRGLCVTLISGFSPEWGHAGKKAEWEAAVRRGERSTTGRHSAT